MARVRQNISFSRNKLPARFPDDVVRVKRTFRTVDGVAFEGQGRLPQKMKSWFRHLWHFFSIYQILVSAFKRLRGY